MQRLVILGATGSIGASTLDVLANLEEYVLVGCSARSNWEALGGICNRFGVGAAALADSAAADSFAGEFTAVKLYSGISSDIDLVRETKPDVVVSATAGAAGLAATLEAAKLGSRICLANKESLVAAGELVKRTAAATGAEIIPVDSEHSAVFQVLDGRGRDEIEKIILTASGGPFRDLPAGDFESVKVGDALNHPTWSMGEKITIDSATMFNKALEVIEAHWLFDLPAEKIGVVVHPQSIVHSIVQFVDGSAIAQLGVPDMRVPIQYALTYPCRAGADFERIDFSTPVDLSFEPVDDGRFPSVKLGYRAVAEGGTMGAVLSAANEVAVERFLAGEIPFVAVFNAVEKVMDSHTNGPADSLESVVAADMWARETAARVLKDN